MSNQTQQTSEYLAEYIDRAEEVDPADFQHIFEAAEPGYTPLEEPDYYRWFLIKNMPIKAFPVSLKTIMQGAEDPDLERQQHDTIVELLEAGEPAWPVAVGLGGRILDGYHRIAAHRTLKLPTIDALVSVPAKRHPDYGLHQSPLEKAWLKEFKRVP